MNSLKTFHPFLSFFSTSSQDELPKISFFKVRICEEGKCKRKKEKGIENHFASVALIV